MVFVQIYYRLASLNEIQSPFPETTSNRYIKVFPSPTHREVEDVLVERSTLTISTSVRIVARKYRFDATGWCDGINPCDRHWRHKSLSGTGRVTLTKAKRGMKLLYPVIAQLPQWHMIYSRNGVGVEWRGHLKYLEVTESTYMHRARACGMHNI